MLMLKPDLSTRDKRKAVFAKIGRALSGIEFDGRDYTAGTPLQFRCLHPTQVKDSELTNNQGGPAMRTQQWERK
jgi:hypothetical protein